MQTTPPNLKWPPPVAYIKFLMQEILADSTFLQEGAVPGRPFLFAL